MTENTAMRRADMIIANFINSDRIKNMKETARRVDKRKITAVQDTLSDHSRSLRTGHQKQTYKNIYYTEFHKTRV